MEKSWYVYVATNYSNTVLYTGITNNIVRRAYEHKANNDTLSFSGRYHLYKIVWVQEFSSPDEAITAEKKIKGWTRAKKLELIQTVNPSLSNLISLR